MVREISDQPRMEGEEEVIPIRKVDAGWALIATAMVPLRAVKG